MTGRGAALAVAAAIAALALPVSATKEEGPAAITCPGKPDSPLCVMATIAGEDGAIRGADEATRLVDHYTSDAVLSDGEKTMLQMLLKAGDEQTAIVIPLDNFPTMEFGVPDQAAVDTVRYFFAPPDVEKALFENDDDALLALIEFYSRGVTGLNNDLDRRCAAKLDETFKASTLMNGYKPYRELISALYQRIKVLEPAQVTTGRTMLYQCANRHDLAVRGAVPDFTYEWVKP